MLSLSAIAIFDVADGSLSIFVSLSVDRLEIVEIFGFY